MSEKISKSNDELWLKLQYKVSEQKIAECFSLFRENEIEPVLIKGWAAAQFYPEKWRRFFTDIDICIEPSDFEKAKKVWELYEGGSLSLDLHRGFRRLDTLSWDDLFEKSLEEKIGDVGIRVLCPEDHLRILIVHWLRDGGGYRDKLWDIYYFIQNRQAEFDWDRFLRKISTKRRKWIVCTIGLAHKYLDLDLKDTPISEEAKDLPKWFVKAIEKEWASDVRLIPLKIARHDRKKFLQQIKKRVPPNPIQATIELEGDFQKYPRIYYQILNIFQRVVNTYRRGNS